MYGTSKIYNMFSMERLFNHMALKLTSLPYIFIVT